MKGPKCWLQASAGDYKGAQPPYLAKKRPEVALSASNRSKINWQVTCSIYFAQYYVIMYFDVDKLSGLRIL